MPRMIELIRASAVPVTIMRSAAKGALSLPPAEMVEILVYLASHPVFGEQARLTLAGWDENSAMAIAGDPATPAEVLNYLSDPKNLRPNLLACILDNASVPDSRVIEVAANITQEQIETALNSARVRNSRTALLALLASRHVNEKEAVEIDWLMAAITPPESSEQCLANCNKERDPDKVLDFNVTEYFNEHAEEIRSSEGQPYTMYGSTAEEQAEMEQKTPTSAVAGESTAVKAEVAAVRMMAIAGQKAPERESVVHKIGRLSVGERVLLALKGGKDERFVLIRDGARVVSNAVLESPKVTENEVESFAGMKNVSESVLRVIAMKRKFVKNYAVIRALTANPRCPIDTSVPLLPHLLIADLKYLSTNKNVSDTVRKLAFKLYRDRLSTH